MNLRELALQQAALKAQIEHLKKKYEETRKATQSLLEKAEEENGTKQITVKLPDGTKVGTISLYDPTTKAEVTDQGAFARWVANDHPSEVTRAFILEVRPAFTRQLLNQIEATRSTTITNPTTGEITEVPGIELTTRRQTGHQLRLTPQGKEALTTNHSR